MAFRSEEYRFGFRVLGDKRSDRRLVDWSAAFRAHCAANEQAAVNRESYLSAFCFGSAFRDYLAATGSTKGFSGSTWSDWLWFDIDRDDLEQATRHVRQLVDGLAFRFWLDCDDLLVFFSGSKGFHVGLPLAVCGSPAPSPGFHRVCRRLAESLATNIGVDIDGGVYDAVRLLRSPNSRHPKTGLHKRRLTAEELELPTATIVELAGEPAGFEQPNAPEVNQQAVDDWTEAIEQVEQERQAAAERRREDSPAALNRSTVAFIRDGATSGDRHRLLFSAAANLAEFGCPSALTFALLSESALDSGLSPSDVRRQIQCGIEYQNKP